MFGRHRQEIMKEEDMARDNQRLFKEGVSGSESASRRKLSRLLTLMGKVRLGKEGWRRT